MTNWQNYPEDYRQLEIKQILSAIQSGESVSLVGLSGAGKSNLLGFLSKRIRTNIQFISVDGNRLHQQDNEGFLKLILRSLPDSTFEPEMNILSQIEYALEKILKNERISVCFLLDRMVILNEHQISLLGANLRSIRDIFKYRLTFVIGTRKPIPLENEIAELVIGNTIWLGPLSQSDAIWSIQSFAKRKGITWSGPEIDKILELSGKYPSFLRGLCEAYANEQDRNQENFSVLEPLQIRIQEFWRDNPSKEALEKSRLTDLPILSDKNKNRTMLTDKENKLLNCFRAHPNTILDKDIIIQSVWPEDKVFKNGIRDDSLSQLIRRLRKKMKTDPENTAVIQTVSGRGYIYRE